MYEKLTEKQRTMYDREPWAHLARQAGYEPYHTESAARHAFSFCAEEVRTAFALGYRRGFLFGVLTVFAVYGLTLILLTLDPLGIR
jgi:hypothetical protein